MSKRIQKHLKFIMKELKEAKFRGVRLQKKIENERAWEAKKIL